MNVMRTPNQPKPPGIPPGGFLLPEEGQNTWT